MLQRAAARARFAICMLAALRPIQSAALFSLHSALAACAARATRAAQAKGVMLSCFIWRIRALYAATPIYAARAHTGFCSPMRAYYNITPLLRDEDDIIISLILRVSPSLFLLPDD